jgi:uncharacterized protein involved in exopolysaccharide biosynthesis
MAGATAGADESQEAIVDGLGATLSLEGGDNDIYVLSAIQNDPQASLQLLKTAQKALEEIAGEIVDNGATAKIQELEQKIHEAQEKLREVDAVRGPAGVGEKSGSGGENQDPRSVTLKSELQALSARRDEVIAARARNAQAHPEIFRVLSQPAEPDEPTGPNRIALHGFVLVTALVIGTILAVGVNFLRPTVNSAVRLKSVTGLPVLGCVGVSESPRFQRAQGRSRLVFAAALAGLVVIFGGLIMLERNGLNLHHLSI